MSYILVWIWLSWLCLWYDFAQNFVRTSPSVRICSYTPGTSMLEKLRVKDSLSTLWEAWWKLFFFLFKHNAFIPSRLFGEPVICIKVGVIWYFSSFFFCTSCNFKGCIQRFIFEPIILHFCILILKFSSSNVFFL